MASPTRFTYETAFARNLGWFTEPEQLALRGKCVAIAGQGGVGGVHLLTLARLGIGAFHIADADTFDLVNFNRQIGATMQTIGRSKVEVLNEMAHAINPELRIERFGEGVTIENIDRFLRGADLFVDGFDFFAIDIRRRVFARCSELGIPAITAAPIGMGTAFLAFAPRGMTFEEYFKLEGQSESEQLIRFLVGLTPKGLHRGYLVDPTRIDLAARRTPSTIAGCELCAGVTAATAARILLGRGGVRFAPYHQHYDAYRGRLSISKLNFGNASPMQRLKLVLARKAFGGLVRRTAAPDEPDDVLSPMADILRAARWAPSGDNGQPWRFDVLGDDTVALHLPPPSGVNIYEYRNGEPLLLAGGMLLESLRIAATAHGRRMEWRIEGSGWPSRIVVRFTPAADLAVDGLYSCLGLRSVSRWRFRTRPLRDQDHTALTEALGERLIVDWYPRRSQRWQFARLAALATDIRLRAPEAFPIHRGVIDWQRRLSPTGIPAGAVGLNRPTLLLMRWAMRNWSRTHLLNRLGSTTMAALQMDYVPILSSGACFSMQWAQPAPTAEDRTLSLLQAGERLQRFWLTATRLGLVLQPLLAMLIFADYGEKSLVFTSDTRVQGKAVSLATSFRRVFGSGPGNFVFMGRIGEPRSRQPGCRSVRRSLNELVQRTGARDQGTVPG
jgi:sulfur-carrier protein adenylyltransferase/sulfurtransferase